MELSTFKTSAELGINCSSIEANSSFFKGFGIFPLNSPQAESAGTIKVDI